MPFEFFVSFVFPVFYSKPVVTRGDCPAIVSTVPALSRRTDLLQQLSVTVKDINFCRGHTLNAYDIPGVVVAVVVGREKHRVVNHTHLDGHCATAIGVGDGHYMCPRAYILPIALFLKRTIIQSEHIVAQALCCGFYGVGARKGRGHGLGTVGDRWG